MMTRRDAESYLDGLLAEMFALHPERDPLSLLDGLTTQFSAILMQPKRYPGADPSGVATLLAVTRKRRNTEWARMIRGATEGRN